MTMKDKLGKEKILREIYNSPFDCLYFVQEELVKQLSDVSFLFHSTNVPWLSYHTLKFDWLGVQHLPSWHGPVASINFSTLNLSFQPFDINIA